MANLHGSIDPVAWQNPLHPNQLSSKPIPNWMPLYTAAPVAQQHKTVTNDEQASAYMDARLWEFIDMAGMWPKAKPDPRIWAHVMVYAPVAQQYEAGDVASASAQGFRDGVTSVAQQPQEIEVQCPVCNHKFYEWPNDKQPQAEAPQNWRTLLLNSEDNFVHQFGVNVSAAWVYRDLEELFTDAAQQAEAVQPGYVLVPVEPTAGMCKAAADAWLDCGSRLVLNKAGAAVRAAIAQQKGGV